MRLEDCSSVQLMAMADDVREFREALGDLMGRCVFVGPPGLGHYVPKDGEEEYVGKTRARVTELGGAAHRWLAAGGGLIVTELNGRRETVNPAASWP